MQEVEIAKRLGRLVIPIGSSHGVAAELWNEINAKPDTLDARIPKDDFALLGDPKASPQQIGAALAKILAAT